MRLKSMRPVRRLILEVMRASLWGRRECSQFGKESGTVNLYIIYRKCEFQLMVFFPGAVFNRLNNAISSETPNGMDV